MKCKIKNVKCKMVGRRKIFNFKFYIFHFQNGFTLAEVLVSMFIFTIITTAVVINYRVGNRNTELRLAAEEMASFIRNAQIMSQAGRTVKLCTAGDDQGKVCETGGALCASCESRVPSGGYGVYMRDRTSAPIFFANSIYPDEKGYNEGESVPTIGLQLPSKVSISTITPSLPLTILFEPPRPRTWINNDSGIVKARITLQHTDTVATRTITVKSISGRIEVSP